MDPVNVPFKFWVGFWTPNIGEEEAVGGDGTVRKSIGDFL